jgi:hypothetical protein
MKAASFLKNRLPAELYLRFTIAFEQASFSLLLPFCCQRPYFFVNI